MVRTVALGTGGGPERIRIDVWERPVVAWPAAVAGSNAAALAREEVQARVHEAFTVELATMGTGDGLRLATVFGQGQCQAALYRTGSLPSPPTTQLGSIMGLGPWSRSEAELPPINGGLVSAVVPQDALGTPIPWANLHLPSRDGDGSPAVGIWSRLSEHLAHGVVPVAVIVDVIRTQVPSHAQVILMHSLAARAAARSQRRLHRHGMTQPEVKTTPHIQGDFAMAVGVVGDFESLLSAWRGETGLSLRSGDSMPTSWLDRLMISQVSAPTAAEFLPLPVLSAHSTVPVKRFRPRTSTVTRPVQDGRGVTVARTEANQEISFDAAAANQNLLVVGDMGTGKSTTTMSLLTGLWNDHGIPWLVIDPLKYEYARLKVAEEPGSDSRLVPVRHLRLGQTPLNPMAIPEGVSPLSFASTMAQAFSSTSALGEAFPLGDQIARTAFNELYAGRTGDSPQPTLADLEAALMAASHQGGMVGEAAHNIRTSLLGRLRAITSGVAGDAFAGGPLAGIDWRELSRFPTVITFPSGTGHQEKAVIYAMLVAAHWSWRLANPAPDGDRHVLVLEEVHQVYGRSNHAASAVLDDLLATMRASGQGYMAVSQTPHQLDERTQRMFQNIVAHRIRHSEGLEMLHAFGAAEPEVQDLDQGEVIALLHESGGVRGRVADRTSGATRGNPMTPADSHRSEEYVTPGPRVRGWCSACPRPCQGRSWLSLASGAAAAADASLRASEDLETAAHAAVRSVHTGADRTAGAPVRNPAGLYCAAARGVTVALGVRGARDTTARTAVALVRNLVLTNPAFAPEPEGGPR